MAAPIEVAAASVRVEPDLRQFGPALTRGINRNRAAALGAARDLGIGLSTAITAPIAGAGALAVREFASFDEALTSSLAIVQDFGSTTREDFERTAQDIARTTRFGTTEAAEAFFFLASAGLSAEQQIGALPTVARFAQAGMFDLATATDLATDAQSALGLTVRDDAAANLENLTRVTDVLVSANTLANASVEQFSRSLTNRAGAALKLVNKDVEEGVAVLAAFADQGVKGEEAGTRLDIVLRDLANATIRNRDEFARYNIEVFDAQGNIRNIADVIGDLEVALAGASDEQKRATLTQLGFQDRSVSSLLTLVGLSDQIREYEAALREAGGTTQTVADRQLQSFSAQLDIARNRIGIAAQTIGAELAPALVAIADFAGDAADAFTALPAPIRNAALVTAGLAAAAGPLLLLGGRIAQTILSLRTLQASQLATAGTARTLAAAEAGAAASIGAVGTAAAGAAAAGRAGAATRTVAGLGTFTLGAAGATGLRGALGRVGSTIGRVGGRALTGGGIAAGLGISFAGELGAGLVSGIETQEGTVGDALKDTASGALRGAGIGATVGSIIPGIGTGIGAGVGALVGGAIGFFRRGGGAEAVQEEVADAVAAGAEIPPEVADLQGRALANTVQGVIDASLAQGIGLEQAGQRGADVREAIEAGLSDGLSFEEARQAAVAEIDGLGDDVAAAVGGIGEQVEPSLGDVASIFQNVFGEARNVSASEIEDLVVEQARQLETFETSVETIYAAGASRIAEQLRAAGPGAAGEAAALAGDIVTALRIEGRLRDVAEDNLDAYVDALQVGDQNTANVLAGVQTIEEIIRGQSPVFADIGATQGDEFIDSLEGSILDADFRIRNASALAGQAGLDGIGNILSESSGRAVGTQWASGVTRGIEAQASRWAGIAAQYASATTASVRDRWQIRSPSRVGIGLGADFAEGINIGIERNTLGEVDPPSLDRRPPPPPAARTETTRRSRDVTINVNYPSERGSIAEGVERGLSVARLAAAG